MFNFKRLEVKLLPKICRGISSALKAKVVLTRSIDPLLKANALRMASSVGEVDIKEAERWEDVLC